MDYEPTEFEIRWQLDRMGEGATWEEARAILIEVMNEEGN